MSSSGSSSSDAARSFDGQWWASGDEWEVTWSPQPPHLSGTRGVVKAIHRELDLYRDGYPVSPTGPFPPSDVSEPLAVAAALWRVTPDRAGIRFEGALPQFPTSPAGMVN